MTNEIQNPKSKTLTFSHLTLIWHLSFGIWIFILVLIAPKAGAAKLYFDPQAATIGTEKEFWLSLYLDADDAVNTVSAGITISPELEPFDIITGNSIINLWIDNPEWDKTKRLLSFSGIIPGGFSGKKARVLIIKLKTAGEGTSTIAFDKQNTKIFLNTPDAQEDKNIQLETLNIPIIKGKENLKVYITDFSPPENFTPEIAQNPGMFNEDYFLVFLTQDKGTGIDHYEVSERKEFKIWNLEFGKRKWIIAKSPYVLMDQKLKSEIWVKAVDRAGNERLVKLSPKNPLAWYEYNLIWVIIILIALIVISGFSIYRFYGGKNNR